MQHEEGEPLMLDQGSEPLASPRSVSVECEATAESGNCQRCARYTVALEEDGPEGEDVLAARHVCADHLAVAADWALTRPTPYAGEAGDVYLTLHERRVTVASLVP